MKLTIDLSKEKIRFILSSFGKKDIVYQWSGLYELSEKLLPELDNFLKKNKIQLKGIRIKVVPSEKSIVSTRIAEATALGLMQK